MPVNEHSLEFRNAAPLRKARVAISISVAPVEEFLNGRSSDLALALPGIPASEHLVRGEVVETALYVRQTKGNSVFASLGTLNISAAPKPKTVIIASKLRRP